MKLAIADLIVAALFCLTIGMVIGGKLEARLWRGKARDGMRKESAGRLYNITEDK